ncbi:unnamed protein product [Linum tenue]|uniref:Protein phosphatase n=1 Tax=Linum tenue TaxID=586396 RepID=A0AAV0IPW3_9ROSI|nr:unnamed protein product [Linum tenue]
MDRFSLGFEFRLLPDKKRISGICRSEVSLCVGSHLIQHPNKVDSGSKFFVPDCSTLDDLFLCPDANSFHRWKRAGKDAFFVSSYNGGVLAVADGVSGWAEEDVYPSLFFFRELIANASGFVPDDESRSTTIPKFSHQESTCCYLLNRLSYRVKIVAMLEGNGMLKFANVGDCGLKLIREGQLIFSTSPQEHYFDCPYQFSSETVGQTYLDAMICSFILLQQ